MPEATKELLSAAIGAGELGAISIDTSVIDKYGTDLRNRVLLGLRQFNGTSIAILFSDLIIGEVNSHITKKARETIVAVLKELRGHRKIWGHNESAEELGSGAHLARDPAEFADQQWKLFSDEVEAGTLVSADLVHLNELTERYFSNAAPFSGTGKKKAEFPDAIALLSLEAWAKSKGKMVLAISSDEDWHAFADQSIHIFCLQDIPEALDHFNREAQFVAQRTLAFLEEQKASGTWSEIESAVELFVEENSWDIEARASLYEPEATMQGGALQYWDENSTPLVIRSDDNEIMFAVDLECVISFEATFDWHVYSDGGWHSMGHQSKSTTEDTRILQFTVTCSSKIETEPEVEEVVVISKPYTVDFGFVDPELDYEE
jgi:hypothetical protein